MVKLNKTKIRKRRAELRRLNEIYTWRKMASEIFNNEVSFQVLARFATDRDYIPASMAALKALDLLTPKSPYRGLPRWYKRIPEALEYFNGKRQQVKDMSDEAKRQRVSWKV